MGGSRSAPRIINTPTGPRRSREDRGREDRPMPRPRTFRAFKPDRIPTADITERDSRKKESFGDSFRESRRESRRMAGDRKDFFERVEKPGKRETSDERIRTFGMADGMPEEIRKRREAIEETRRNFGTTTNRSMQPFPRERNQDQNIARTDV